MTVRSRTKFLSLVTLLSLTTALVPPAAFADPLQPNDNNTTTPIKHVIVIYGENRSFDHLYATYQPKSGETVNNLLSEGIINVDGTPGEIPPKQLNFARPTPILFKLPQPRTDRSQPCHR
jgi:phospholipase C